MGSRLIFLGGAPKNESLEWDATQQLESSFCSPIKRFLGEIITDDTASPKPSSSNAPPSKWRRLTPKSCLDPEIVFDDIGSSENYQTQFYSFNAKGVENAESQERIQFLEHSLAFLNELDSSQIIASPDLTSYHDQSTISSIFPTSLCLPTTVADDDASTSMDDSFSTTSLRSQHPSAPLHLPNPLTDISRIPSATHLIHVQPQTITLNLLAAIITQSPPRRVALRRSPHTEMDIHELLVGDETRAGLSVTFWLTASDESKPGQQQRRRRADDDDGDIALHTTLRGLRAGDVVCVRNVALAVWKGKVYGQSLRRRAARLRTEVVLLDEEALKSDDNVTNAQDAARLKLRRVRAWRDEFVGVATNKRINAKRSRKRGYGMVVNEEEDLPPDTQ